MRDMFFCWVVRLAVYFGVETRWSLWGVYFSSIGILYIVVF